MWLILKSNMPTHWMYILDSHPSFDAFHLKERFIII